MLFVRKIIQRILKMCNSNLVNGFTKLRRPMLTEKHPQGDGSEEL